MRNKIVDAAEAVAIIRSGDTVASSGFVGVGLPIRSGRFSEEPEEFRRNHLWIVQRNKVSRVNHDDFGLRNERTGPLRKLFGYSLVA